MVTITMELNGYRKTFRVFQDCSYQMLNGNKWSETLHDFADAYIKLREAGFKEVCS